MSTGTTCEQDRHAGEPPLMPAPHSDILARISTPFSFSGEKDHSTRGCGSLGPPWLPQPPSQPHKAEIGDHGTRVFSKLASSVCPTCSAMHSLKAKEYGPRERKLGLGLPSASPNIHRGALHLEVHSLSWMLGFHPWNRHSCGCSSSRTKASCLDACLEAVPYTGF